MRESLCRALEQQRGANIIPALLAQRTNTACHTNLQGHSVAHLERRAGRTNGYDEAGRFMAQTEGSPNGKVAIAVVGVVVQVGTTETCAVDLDLDFGWWRGGDWAGFLGESDLRGDDVDDHLAICSGQRDIPVPGDVTYETEIFSSVEEEDLIWFRVGHDWNGSEPGDVALSGIIYE
jgi:hypothetical protein